MITLFRKYPLIFSIVYLFLYQGLGSAIIGGGSEFGIAYGMYHNSPHLVTLWAFPNTLSGDCALTLFIQVGLTWVVEELMVGYDDYLDNTFEFPNWFVEFWYNLVVIKTGKFSRFMQWYFEINNGVMPYKDNNKFSNNRDIDLKKMSLFQFLKRHVIKYPNEKLYFNIIEWLLRKVLRAMLFAVTLFIFVWPICMGIFASIGTKINGHDRYFNNYPEPELMKLSYGAVIGMITTPCSVAVIILRNRIYERVIRDRSFIFKVNTSDATRILNFSMPNNVEELPSQLFTPPHESDYDSTMGTIMHGDLEIEQEEEYINEHLTEEKLQRSTSSPSTSNSMVSSLPKSIIDNSVHE
ncbi:similar to Saccharomyces cerevisiae YHL026C Putative protein of unknown function [Maudiozyma barnettii]|uniref:Uncharacterized protein n=1 Tax=Maudiozyma barnettii TaxID=61262 RepID=A0A8H2ZF94_9SACH|nr:hypothetical protein [Kazachstania barnettii]CAB4253001.1 similar to Saccharomyces cerevisiae YHL026C Putative protein of unknown function [Kazachstania barnettii]CAD1780147.1 similar to Saccharomyces cerevisiae YHL026C Putative protein of unknown function [Kazachstania barnettii]